MKCEIAKDLLALYADDLCSPETVKQLEAHLAECPNCKAQLAHYRKDIEDVDTEDAAESSKALKPMKKIRKKLRRRVILAIVLGLLLLALLSGIGVLGYGQMTNNCVSFSVVADVIRLNDVTQKLTEGDTEALLDVLAFRIEDYYAVNKLTELDGMKEYKANLKEQMDEAYAHYFEGKDIRVKLSQVDQIPYQEGYVITENGDYFVTEPTYTIYYYDFYEGDTLVLSMEFAKLIDGKYMAYDTDPAGSSRSEVSFTANTLPYDDLLHEVMLRYTTRMKNEAIRNGETDATFRYLSMAIRQYEPGSEEDTSYRDTIEARMQTLYENGWIPKEILFDVDSYDEDARCWIYKVWFQFENIETGESCIMEQRFCLHDSILYIMEDQPAEIIGVDEKLPEEIREALVTLFS